MTPFHSTLSTLFDDFPGPQKKEINNDFRPVSSSKLRLYYHLSDVIILSFEPSRYLSFFMGQLFFLSLFCLWVFFFYVTSYFFSFIFDFIYKNFSFTMADISRGYEINDFQG